MKTGCALPPLLPSSASCTKELQSQMIQPHRNLLGMRGILRKLCWEWLKPLLEAGGCAGVGDPLCLGL